MKNNALLKYYQMMGSKPPKPTGYIKFEDPEVERICIENFSSDGVGVTYEDAAKVTDLREIFRHNKLIKTFNELVLFTNLGSLSFDFQDCTNLTNIILPDKLRNVGSYSFYATNIKEINFKNVEKMADNVFQKSKLTQIGANKFKSIGNGAFRWSYDLSGILDIKEVDTISSFAFQQTDIDTIFLRDIVSIGDYAFQSRKLKTLLCDNITPPKIGSTTFLNAPFSDGIYVPDPSLDTYKTAPNWSAFADKIKPLSTYKE